MSKSLTDILTAAASLTATLRSKPTTAAGWIAVARQAVAALDAQGWTLVELEALAKATAWPASLTRYRAAVLEVLSRLVAAGWTLAELRAVLDGLDRLAPIAVALWPTIRAIADTSADAAATGPTSVTPPVTAPPTMTVHGQTDPPVPGAIGYLQAVPDSPLSSWPTSSADAHGHLVWPVFPRIQTSHLVVDATGYQRWSRTVTDLVADITIPVLLEPIEKPLPAPPSRMEILRAIGNFQPSRQVTTKQFGTIPFFDAYLGSLPLAEDRQAVYAQRREDGRKRITLSVSYAYREPGQPYEHVAGRDFSNDLPALRELILEIIREGFYVDLRCAGDGQSNATRTHNDPQGDTYGHQWLMEHIERIHAALADLDPFIVWGAGYDGIWNRDSPWTKEQLFAWWDKIRSLVGPNGYVSMEWGAGKVHTGDPGETYQAEHAGKVDVHYLEFPWPIESNWDETWQIAARMLGPAYRRPENQPDGNDPAPTPHYLAAGTPRGPWVVQADEFATYGVCRGVAQSKVAADRAYLRSCGFELVG